MNPDLSQAIDSIRNATTLLTIKPFTGPKDMRIVDGRQHRFVADRAMYYVPPLHDIIQQGLTPSVARSARTKLLSGALNAGVKAVLAAPGDLLPVQPWWMNTLRQACARVLLSPIAGVGWTLIRGDSGYDHSVYVQVMNDGSMAVVLGLDSSALTTRPTSTPQDAILVAQALSFAQRTLAGRTEP